MRMLIKGDARAIPLVDGCVQTCITSPPYFGLRQYPDARQIGLERSPDEYVASIVEVFREVRRVLRSDGTVWLNLGDGYAGGGKGGGGSFMAERKDAAWQARSSVNGWRSAPAGMKSKDLLGIPWMVAFALRADGWYLRSEITWCKTAPMPESCCDRPTSATEKVFLLSKSARYYWDADAVRNPVSVAMLGEVADGYNGTATKFFEAAGVQNASTVKSRIIANARKRLDKQRGHSKRHAGFNDRWDQMTKEEQTALGSNMRNWMVLGPDPYPENHFATFPRDLVEPFILAGAPLGGLVLDCFTGSGTVGEMCSRTGRRFVGVDLSYQDLAKQRTAQRGLMFAEAR